MVKGGGNVPDLGLFRVSIRMSPVSKSLSSEVGGRRRGRRRKEIRGGGWKMPEQIAR
jgi:hypothetical protein